MQPIAKLISNGVHRGFATVEITFDPNEKRDECDLALAIGAAVLACVRKSEDQAPITGEESLPKLPDLGDMFEGQRVIDVKVGKTKPVTQIKLSDGTLIGFDKNTGKEIGRKVPEQTVPSTDGGHAAGTSETAPPGYPLQEYQTLSDLAEGALAQEGGDKEKAMAFLELIKDKHPVLKNAASTWRDRCERRMVVKLIGKQK